MHMKRVYLSIDLDYWNGLRPRDVENWLLTLFTAARKKHIPIAAVTNHQQLTRYVNTVRPDVLVNVDTHSDLATPDVMRYECGTWVSYVQNRAEMEYVWIHRLGVDEGDCNEGDPIFTEYSTRVDKTDYKGITRIKRRLHPNPKDLLKGCVEIGFCLSPAYTYKELQPVFRNLAEYFGLYVVRGRKDEELYGIDRKVPPSKKTKSRKPRSHKAGMHLSKGRQWARQKRSR